MLKNRDMKQIFQAAKAVLVCVFLLAAVVLSAQERRYVQAYELNVIGKALPTGGVYQRFDPKPYGMNGLRGQQAEMSTGLAVCFKTDARSIGVRWKIGGFRSHTNMTPTVACGFDLYIKRDGHWVFAGSVGPGRLADQYEATLVRDMAEGEKECVVYLPTFDHLDEMELSVEEGARIEPMPNPFRHKIVVKGSSITHGASASRPGATWPARLCRELGLYCVNMGFSGNSKLQEDFAHVLADMEMDAIIFDAFSNPSAEDIRARFDTFVDIIREAHPDIPLIFIQTLRRDSGNFNETTRAYEREKKAAAAEVAKRRAKMDKNLYFLEVDEWIGTDGYGSVDGIHPNDLGIDRMLRQVSPKVARILKKYGIK